MLGLTAGLIGLFLLLVSPSPHSHLGGSLRPILGLAWLAFGVMVASSARAGVVVDKNGISVRTRFRRSNYRWGEIRNFEFRPSLADPHSVFISEMDETFALSGSRLDPPANDAEPKRWLSS